MISTLAIFIKQTDHAAVKIRRFITPQCRRANR
ncbi:Uncharacterised protein [Vibrio cholerae]|nr:Uncharacterised protein [Vibrio cholerae]